MRILRVAQCGSKLRVRDLPVVVLVGVLLGDGEDVLVREGQVERANTQLKLEERKLAGLVQVKLTERRLEQVVPERKRNQRSSAAICHCQRLSEHSEAIRRVYLVLIDSAILLRSRSRVFSSSGLVSTTASITRAFGFEWSHAAFSRSYLDSMSIGIA